MSQKEYFNHLCKTHAGEFIYKTVNDVEGIYQMRPRNRALDWELGHLYAMEDPYGYTTGEANEPAVIYLAQNRYRYFEKPLSSDNPPSWKQRFRHPSFFVTPAPDDKHEGFFGYDNRDFKTMKKEYSTTRKSRYGFTWRGIARRHHRELGVAGGELIVMDLQTEEVLGVRRGFIMSGSVRNMTGFWWLTGQTCPKYGFRNGRDKDFDFSYWFIGKVLRPLNYELSFEELNHAK